MCQGFHEVKQSRGGKGEDGPLLPPSAGGHEDGEKASSPFELELPGEQVPAQHLVVLFIEGLLCAGA